MKDTVKTKTFWTAVASIATGIGLICAGNQPEGIQLIAAAAMAIFMRSGISKVQKR